MKRVSSARSGAFAMLGSLTLLALAGTASGQSVERLAQADANGDGQIEWQEMLDLRAAMFERLDRNGDGFADEDDSPRFGPGKARFGEGLARIRDADTDGDGRISQAEIMDAPAPIFEEGDTDGDKVLSAEELTTLRDTMQAG